MHLVVSCFPGPSIPEEQRPWRQTRTLPEEEFKEELRQWGVVESFLNDESMFSEFRQVLRADCCLYDEYEFREGDNLEVDIDVIRAIDDNRIKEEHTQLWTEQLGMFNEINFHQVEGHHLFFQPVSVGGHREGPQNVCRILLSISQKYL